MGGGRDLGNDKAPDGFLGLSGALSVSGLDLASKCVGDNEREDHKGLDKNETDDHRRKDLPCS